jgi:hypothetical protein
VAAVRPDDGSGPAAGDRPAPLDLSLAEALSNLAPTRPRVRFEVPGIQPITGELQACGADLLSIATDRGAGGVVYVPLASVAAVVVLASG